MTPDDLHQIRLATFNAARAAVSAGLSLIPIAADGTKGPAWRLLPRTWDENCRVFKHYWRIYASRPPTPDELALWFLEPGIALPCGFAIIGGAVSGGLEVIDFDAADLFDVWAARIHAYRPALLQTLTIVRSPRPGIHVYFRSTSCGSSRKLAQRPDVDETSGKTRSKTLIEVKGEGGYVLAPGSPGWCHPTGSCYQFVTSNGYAQIPTVSFDDRNLMLVEALRFNEVVTSHPSAYIHSPRPAASNRPGDLFAAATAWSSILEPHGWVCTGENTTGMGYWRRPGKFFGQSATTNYGDYGLLHVFSENADPFEAGRSYSKFNAHALLNFNGDFIAAARALVAQGFTPRKAGPVLPPWVRRRSGVGRTKRVWQ